MTEVSLEFEDPIYSIKLSYGRRGKIFKFKLLKKTKDYDVDLQSEKQPESVQFVSQMFFPFNGNFSLKCVPGICGFL